MKKILIIDDNGRGLDTLGSLLREHGYSTTEVVDDVREANDALWQSEKRYRDLFENAPVGIFRSTPEGEFLSVNPAMAQMLKYDSPEEMIWTVNRTNIAEVMYLDPPHRLELIESVLSHNGWQVFEERFRCKDGSTITCNFHLRAIRGDDASYELNGFIEDISERKRAEEALRESENRFRLIVETAAEGIWQVDREWKTTYLNRRMEEMFGVEPGTMLGLHICDFMDEEGRQTVGELMSRREKGIRETHDFRFVRRDGFSLDVLVSASPLYDESGKFAGSFAMVTDITDRKRAEEASKLSQFIIDKASIGIFRVSGDARILSVNEHWARVLGYTQEELCSMSFFDIDPNLTTESWLEHRKKLTAAGLNTFETVHRRKDGSIFPVEVTVNYLKYQDHEFSCSFAMDITERKQAEEQLIQKKQQLRELNSTLESRVAEEVAKNREKDIMLMQQNRQAALGEMLDHIAHQWKQPLNSISLIVQDLGESALHGELTDERIEETVSKTIALLDHMAQTIDVFRDFYRSDKEKQVFNVKDSIDQALAFVAPDFRFQCIAIELDVDPGLTAFGYPKEYAQVLLNILTNARDVFNESDMEQPRVIIRAFAEDRKAVVTITDNAGGIPETIIGKIFDLSFTTREKSGGTGIGLYISKNIIEKNMDGKLSAENTGDGALFRIEISST